PHPEAGPRPGWSIACAGNQRFLRDVCAFHGQNGTPQPLRELEMNASTLVICRDEIDPRRVRISGTNADHLVMFSDTIPLALLKEILARIEQDPKATVRLIYKGRGKPLAAVGAFVGPTRRRIGKLSWLSDRLMN